ncbi:hypothetical protein K6Q96_23290 [Grimontia kaedaensis]|uniref:SnoaL-like domain-containing protein n=1 Tax=Grimontia kaedaensis TaxID=2872157 RepID=A0ABY4X098_9GAMM|nr:hypothetical protein [Grimontia kaedaensis]USH04647.1 hypothetical protein K6Q96_23290 [Grimontia kaedaensis]
MKKQLMAAAIATQMVFAGAAYAGPIEEAQEASKQWIAAFNKGDYQYLGDAYTMESTMISHPFGVYHGRPAATAFWKQLISDGATDLVYIEPKFAELDDKTVVMESRWKMNIGEGHITLEKWVKEADGVWRLELDDFTVEKRY